MTKEELDKQIKEVSDQLRDLIEQRKKAEYDGFYFVGKCIYLPGHGYMNVETKELEDVECHGLYSKELERKVNDKLLDEWQSRFDAENPESKGEPAWVKLANARAKRNRNNR